MWVNATVSEWKLRLARNTSHFLYLAPQSMQNCGLSGSFLRGFGQSYHICFFYRGPGKNTHTHTQPLITEIPCKRAHILGATFSIRGLGVSCNTLPQINMEVDGDPFLTTSLYAAWPSLGFHADLVGQGEGSEAPVSDPWHRKQNPTPCPLGCLGEVLSASSSYCLVFIKPNTTPSHTHPSLK